jgi:hypothetical protein
LIILVFSISEADNAITPVDSDPEVAFDPDQSPEAVHEVAPEDVQLIVAAVLYGTVKEYNGLIYGQVLGSVPSTAFNVNKVIFGEAPQA